MSSMHAHSDVDVDVPPLQQFVTMSVYNFDEIPG